MNAQHVFGSHSDLCLYCGIGEGFFSRHRGKPCPERKAKERDDKDYAIEFGGYLADAAEQFIHAYNFRQMQEQADVDVDVDAFNDIYRALTNAIFEFRKRSAKVVSG
jgi:hypothetical protein